MIKKNDLRLRICVIVALMLFSVFYAFSFHRSKTEGVKMLVDTRVLDKFDLKLGVKSKINLGLDLKGGMYVLLRADTRGIASAKVGDALSGAIEKIRNRIDVYGVNEPSIQLQGNNTILVQVPGKLDPNVVKKLREVGKLEFKLVDANADNLAQAVSGQIPQGFELKQYNKDNILIEKETSLDGSTLLESFLGADQYGRSEVRLRFTSEGSKQFAKVTEANVGRQLAIVLDGKVMSAPVINEPILSGQAQISGSFSPEEARALISVLNSGALPVPLTLEEERSVGPLLGSDSIRRGVKSILFGAALVIVFMLGYYLVGGFIAVICLFLDLLFVLAGLHLFGATLTLPGIAGMILTLGMAVDANVLIFERIREELQSKKPLSVAAANGFDRAKRTIFDANITTLIAAVFLYFFGTGPIRGFAITLSLGIIASIFTAVFVGRTLFAVLINFKLKKFTMLRFVPDSHINFIKIRNFCFILSLVAVGLGTHNFYSQSEEIYGIDFKGGQNLEYRIIPEVSVDVVRNLLSKEGLTDLVIQEFTDIDGGILIKSSKVVDEQVETTLKQNFDNVESLRVTTVGPAVGKILKKKALLAFILSIIGILIYVGFRFKHFDFAFTAVIALFHDVLISLGALAFFGFKVDLLTITALLTIAGYSINDTIVVYDRIREITPQFKKLQLNDIINQAINNTLSRTFITSLTTIMVVVAMYYLGGEALRGFSFTLLVGFIVGTYSSIFIASPLVLLFNKRAAKKKK